MPQIITVASGKGGVGKTNISVNLALRLAAGGLRVCLFDADLGLANINILLGIYPEVNLAHVITGEKTLADILIKNYMGIDIVPGGTGIAKLANLQPTQIESLINEFSALDAYDIVVLDASAGAGGEVTSFCRAASQVLLIITPEPTSLTDAYSLLKILSTQGFSKHVQVIVNQARTLHHAKVPYLSLSRTVSKHLPLKISAIGYILQDPHVAEAVRLQKPFLSLFPKAAASVCIRKIAERLISGRTDGEAAMDMKAFWSSYLDLKEPFETVTASHPAPAVFSNPADFSTMLAPVLKDIAGSLADISTQIRAILELMKQRHPEPASDMHKGDTAFAMPMFLDFEAFLKDKKK